MNVAFITTCRDRLDHVKQSSKLLLADERVAGNLFFVDSFCPQQSGTWMSEYFDNDVKVIRLSDMAEVSEVPPFSKPLALNTGAHHAIKAGYQYLAFIDADTLVTPQLLDFVFENLSPNSWQIFASGVRDLTGFLVTHQRPFVAVGGYDRLFEGWGTEDLDLRIKLHCYPSKPVDELIAQGGRSWTQIPKEFASAIEHSDALRGKHHVQTDVRIANLLNMNRLAANFFRNTGVHLADLHGTKLGDNIRVLMDFTD